MTPGARHYCDPILQSRKLGHWEIKRHAQDPTGASDRAGISAGQQNPFFPSELPYCSGTHALAPRLPLHPSPPSPPVHPPLSLAVHTPASTSIPLLPRNSVGRGGPVTTWLLLPLPHPSTPWTAAKTPAAGLSWRKGGRAATGRKGGASTPSPRSMSCTERNNVTLGLLPGVRVGAGPWTWAWPSCFQEAGGPWSCLCPDFLCDLSSASSIPAFQL